LSEEEITQLTSILAPMGEAVKYYAGNIGLNVYGAQQRLGHLGYEVSPSGIMDGQTVEIIKEFQADEGLYPYGGLDFTTMKALATAFEAYLFGGGQDLQLEAAIQWLSR
jgi:carboxyl-terminal processing protease